MTYSYHCCTGFSLLTYTGPEPVLAGPLFCQRLSWLPLTFLYLQNIRREPGHDQALAHLYSDFYKAVRERKKKVNFRVFLHDDALQ